MPLPEHCLAAATANTQPIILTPVTTAMLQEILTAVSEREKAWLTSTGFKGDKASTAVIAGEGGALERVYVGMGSSMPEANDPWWLAAVCSKLPEGDFALSRDVPADIVQTAALGWCLAHYAFDRYKSKPATTARTLFLDKAETVAEVTRTANAMALAKDMVNTPAEDMGPFELQDIAETLAEAHGGSISTIVGDDLLDENLPAIHAVGRAAANGREPRLIDLRWGDTDAPSLTLVGKGVCFDTGGLDVKPSAGMRYMKKDMGGAAHVVGLAQLIMESKLPVNLRVLIPAVENAVAANSYRPGDVVQTRKGLTVEIGNTDAEGRVVLCDALALACEDQPDLLIDFATLTGAARVALGADLPATYTNKDTVWQHLESGASQSGDPLWRMPLWAPYDEDLSSSIADMNNIADGGFAGSITAALYLQRFIDVETPWVHIDVFAWSKKSRPGRPVGGDAQGIRATFTAIREYLKV